MHELYSLAKISFKSVFIKCYSIAALVPSRCMHNTVPNIFYIICIVCILYILYHMRDLKLYRVKFEKL